ncbi:MAG: N-acetyltransferase, partial [Planctomycetota bacterium]|nr:N-acetyltransferase [Planctomycetota bacterium]
APAGSAAAESESVSWSVRLRIGRVEDVPAILELEDACFNTLDETFNRRQLRYLLGSPRATVTVAESEGRIVGWSVGLVRQHRKSRSGRIYAVAVHPAVQGRRLGQALVEHTLEALSVLGIDRVFLEIRADNEAAIRLYRRLGFAEQKQLPNHFGPGRHGRSMKLGLLDDQDPGLFADVMRGESFEVSMVEADAALQVTRGAGPLR